MTFTPSYTFEVETCTFEVASYTFEVETYTFEVETYTFGKSVYQPFFLKKIHSKREVDKFFKGSEHYQSLKLW